MSIPGIKSVDFILKAVGEGVVNHNGAFSVWNPAAGQIVDNHMFPKLRGLDPMQRVGKAGVGSMAISLTDEAISQAALIVSAECIRAQLFRNVSFGLAKVTVENVAPVLASLHGLVRGYLITEGSRNFARKSCLYVTDFECPNPQLSFNQGTNSKVRGTEDEKTSIYSYFKTGKNLQYTGKASLNIEELQFVPMENSLGRSAFDHQVSVATGKKVAAGITQYLTDIAPENSKPEARFVKKVSRIGAVSQVGDAGILLNDDAIRIIAAQIHEMLAGLCIRQGKGYLQVTDVVVDYNDSTRVFRAEANPTVANADPTGKVFASYYIEHDVSDAEFEAQQALAQAKVAEKAAIKDKEKAEKAARKTASKKGSSEVAPDTAASV